jgi:hypothetical protein
MCHKKKVRLNLSRKGTIFSLTYFSDFPISVLKFWLFDHFGDIFAKQKKRYTLQFDVTFAFLNLILF